MLWCRGVKVFIHYLSFQLIIGLLAFEGSLSLAFKVCISDMEITHGFSTLFNNFFFQGLKFQVL